MSSAASHMGRERDSAARWCQSKRSLVRSSVCGALGWLESSDQVATHQHNH